MTTNPTNDMTIEELDEIAESARDLLRRRIDEMEAAKTSQPERLAKARSDAEEARGWALLEEPWDDQVTALPAYNADGERTGAAITLPSITARELWGARLCFDLLDCGDDFDQVDAVIGRAFAMVHGDTGLAMILMSSALSTIATLVVPQLLDEIEHSGSNYDERVRLSEARAKAWNGRVSELRGPQDDATDCGVKPIDGYDIGANALDPDALGGEA
jgi:hypothetical protein